MGFLNEVGLARVWERCSAAFSPKNHTHSYLTLTDDWSEILYQIRNGHGADILPVGRRLNVAHGDFDGGIIMDVMGHDVYTDPTGLRGHTMTIRMRHCTAHRFDAMEALYYAEAGLAAGTYHFTLAALDTAYGGGKTLQFTLAQAVPTGGVITFPWVYNTQCTATNIITYPSRISNTAIETVGVTEGSGGTDLGTADGVNGCNHHHRFRYGSNNYAESAIRQWMNSAAAANEWWTPQTNYDRLPVGIGQNGFLRNLEPGLAAALIPVDIVTARNTVYEEGGVTGGSYTLRDKLFLPSVTEMGLGNNGDIAEGATLPYYDGAAQADRIKYDIAAQSTARNNLLRSPNPINTYRVRNITAAGALSTDFAYAGERVAMLGVVG